MKFARLSPVVSLISAALAVSVSLAKDVDNVQEKRAEPLERAVASAPSAVTAYNGPLATWPSVASSSVGDSSNGGASALAGGVSSGGSYAATATGGGGGASASVSALGYLPNVSAASNALPNLPNPLGHGPAVQPQPTGSGPLPSTNSSGTHHPHRPHLKVHEHYYHKNGHSYVEVTIGYGKQKLKTTYGVINGTLKEVPNKPMTPTPLAGSAYPSDGPVGSGGGSASPSGTSAYANVIAMMGSSSGATPSSSASASYQQATPDASHTGFTGPMVKQKRNKKTRAAAELLRLDMHGVI